MVLHTQETYDHELGLKSCLDRHGVNELVIVVDGQPYHVIHLQNFGTYISISGWKGVDQHLWLDESDDPELAKLCLDSARVWDNFHSGKYHTFEVDIVG